MDPADEASALAEAERNAVVARHRRLGSARPLAKPSSGVCRSCGDPIDVKRLAALPGAENCIDCERDREKVR